MRLLHALLALSWLVLQPSGLLAEAKPLKVKHMPEQPKSGQVVRVTVTGLALTEQRGLTLQYQLVEPGRYIELGDPTYTNQWVSVPMMSDAAQGQDDFVAELPASLQLHRRLVRYRIAAGDRVIAPDHSDAQPNFAYFVYDGVPPWRAAIQPGGDDPVLGKPVTFSAEVMNSVPVYHFIAKRSSVENTTWYQPEGMGENRHRYLYTGTIVAGGRVYDHVRFRARGGEWRHAMGKNMWKFDFNRGHHLQARDNFGIPYRTKWEKLNLGACIQQANYHRRGEHGLYEAVTYRLFNLTGVPAPHTHYVHLRIIDQPKENPSNQYEGDFWGLYLATEEIDDHFLEEHRLPDGNIYKWDFGEPRLEYHASGAASNREDVLAFAAGYRRAPAEAWWRDNVDLARYFSYRSILECVHHYDIAFGKNYFYYFHSPTHCWIVLPWDVDLTWKNTMYGTGQEPFWRAGLLRHATLNLEYQNRLREIRDLLFNPEQTGLLIEEFAAVISDPAGGLSFADADRAKWDYHPIMTSRWVNPNKAMAGQFYAHSPTRDFAGMVQLMKEYVQLRGRWCDSNLLSDSGNVPAPTIVAAGPLERSKPTLTFRATVPSDRVAPAALEWRLAEVTLGPVTRPLRPRQYEIEELWRSTNSATADIPVTLFAPGHTYRVRARSKDAAGRCSHWSEPVQITPAQ